MSKNWYSISLGDGMMADLPREEIREKFLKVFDAGPIPLDAAVFTRNDSEGRLHCEVTAFFSPAANEIAKWFKAKPCEKPERDNLDLLVGNESCWQELFS